MLTRTLTLANIVLGSAGLFAWHAAIAADVSVRAVDDSGAGLILLLAVRGY